ncbi:MAG: NAD(P)-binding domain-containing protein [Anaerolineae bacterium]
MKQSSSVFLITHQRGIEMKVGIIGAGAVGVSLGKALIRAGHEVMFSSREPQSDKAQQVRTETGAPVESLEKVIAFSPVLALAMPPDAALQTAREYSPQLAGKVLIDMNNRLGSKQSFAQELAGISGARVVKAFNTIGAEHYQNPVFEGQHASMLIAGEDAEAKRWVSQLASDIGFDVLDVGGLDAVEHVENLAKLWIHLMLTGHGRDFAFKLIKR